MLRSTFYSFTTALRGLNTAQKQLDITGNNISNVGRLGYTRQRADVYSSSPAGYGDRYGSINNTLVGQGSIVGGISQSRDQFLDVRFRRESANLGEESEKLGTMEDISMFFDEIEKGGLMTSFSDFISKLQSLAGNAESSEFDSIARDSAANLVKQFNQYAQQLSNVRDESEFNLKEITIKSLNDIVTNIASLNASIRQVQSAGGPALELKDERNLLIDQLSSFMKLDVKYTPKDVGGGKMVDDVSISIVGADGKSHELIFNDTASVFNVETGKDKDAVVTIDTSPLEAKKTLTELNNLLKSISMNNTSLQDINNKLKGMYPLQAPPYTYKDLADDTTTTPVTKGLVSKEKDNITRITGELATTDQALADARQALKDRLADTVNPPTDAEKETLRAAINTALTKKSDLIKESEAASEAHKTLSTYQTKSKKYAKGAADGDASLKSILENKGIVAEQMWNAGDYSTCYYRFYNKIDYDTDPTTAVPLQKDGAEIQWAVGIQYEKLTRDELADIGVVFTSKLDAAEVASPGALKGALDMLNSEGVFDYGSSQIRGIGYYEKMLDSLADKLATTLNKINDLNSTTDKEDLFETSDGNFAFTAENIRISEDWLNGKYGITGTQNPNVGDNSGKAENILLMISTISSKMDYSTGPIVKQDNQGNYLDNTGRPIANGRDANGNYTWTQPGPGGTDVTTLVCNKDFIAYKNDGFGNMVLDAKTVSPNPDPTAPGTFVDPGGNVVANGKDKDGNYVMNAFDADGKITSSTLVANPDGIMYQVDGAGDLVLDTKGKPILDGVVSPLDKRDESHLYNGTFQEFLTNVSNVLALDISSTSNLAANHDAILGSIQTAKESISSVSLDEEGVNIMQFQKAYSAAARMMTALDEAIDKVINQMGTVGR